MLEGTKRKIALNAGLVFGFLLLHYAVQLLAAAEAGTIIPAGLHRYLPFVARFTLTALAIFTILLLGSIVERLIARNTEVEGTRYNLSRVNSLIVFLLIAIVGVSFIFQNLYAAAVSFGLISLILGFALQAPITSFIAWLYIIFRHPYLVGDRIQLGNLYGDVLEIGYLDTIIQEFGGPYLGNDRLSGRVIHFPNSLILKSEIINYSGQFQPFIWNETAIQIAYVSDLSFVESCLLQAANADFAASYPGRPLVDAEVYFRDNDRAWLEAVLSYPVEPTDTTGRRTRILRAALPEMTDAHAQGRVVFPNPSGVNGPRQSDRPSASSTGQG